VTALRDRLASAPAYSVSLATLDCQRKPRVARRRPSIAHPPARVMRDASFVPIWIHCTLALRKREVALAAGCRDEGTCFGPPGLSYASLIDAHPAAHAVMVQAAVWVCASCVTTPAVLVGCQ
jgi:hypothetical protein